ncbi:LysR family transcriptional regulator [Leucobacter musarum]|uniref:LysR family transcriptional regulator n=1 Tax=Leucobacter musarum TaxID=1930747 RepID=UPI0006A78A86|nr:LysR substrate-binding domain-containing protein [Leucobacter musarum]
MELRQLRYFLAVSDELHFGRAAEQLHMSQPPLSLQISRLEHELGVTLFERSTRSVRLTAAGRHLQTRARAVLAELDEVRGELRDFTDGLTGTLRVGFVSSANSTVLPGVARRFRAERPGVTLELVPLTSSEQLERLRDGSLDVAIVRDEAPGVSGRAASAIRTEVVYEERLVACLPRTHPLASAQEVTAHDISAVPMITYPRAMMSGFVDRVTQVLGEAGSVARVAEEVVHQETAIGFVAAGVGTSILPESIGQLVPPTIVTVPLAGSPTTQLLAARRVRSDHGAAIRAFLACLRASAAELRAPTAAAA